jgi:hypothetical protein
MAVTAGNTNGVKAQAGGSKIKSKNQYKREKAKLKKQAATAAPTPVRCYLPQFWTLRFRTSPT